MKRIAVLTAASLSASMALTAMPVFAADVVSVEASDATTVVSPEGGTNASADATAIRTDLASATVELNTTATGYDGLSNKASTYKVTGGTASTPYTYGVDSVSDVTFKMNSANSDIESAKVTLTLSVAKTSNGVTTGAGTATVTVDLISGSVYVKYTAAQKLAALKMYAEAKVAAKNEYNATGYGFTDSDNRISVLSKAGLDDATIDVTTNLKKIIADQTSGGTVKTEGYSKAAKISAVTVGTATKATSSTTGSLPITLTYSVDVFGSDEKTTTQTATSSLTGVIPTTKQQNDNAYAGKIEAAVAAATWTTDDFDKSGGGTELSTSGLAKLKNVILSVDDNALVSSLTSNDVTVGRYSAGTHGKDGEATLSFSMGRKDGDQQKTDTFSAKVTVVEGDAHVQSELKDAFKNGVAAAATSLQADAVADKDAAVKVITDAIDAELAKTYNNKAYSADIKGYEIVVPADGDYTQATTAHNGEIKFYIKVDTGRTSSADPSKTDVWYFNADDSVSGTATYSANINTATATTDTGVAGEDYLIDIQKLAKLEKVAATSIALPSTVSYNVNAAGTGASATGIALKDYLTINPDGANTYTIRWTNSNAYDSSANPNGYALSDGTTSFKDSYVSTGSTTSSATLPTLKYYGSSKASTTITAELLDGDGNVVAKASTVVTAMKGFDDVQKKSYFAYDAINALSNTIKQEDDSTALTEKNYKANGAKYDNLTIASGKKISSSPVIQGTGKNKFDPYADVTRAQFVTFLYRNACNEYTFTKTGYDKDPASYTATTKFSDVAADKYYAKAVAWAVDNGIVNGKTDTTFAPDAKITRAEAVTMIYRLQANGASYSSRQNFTDVNTSAYYADAVGYASYAGITNGKTDSTFAPNDTVTRGEAATFIYRAVDGDDGFYYSPVES